MLSWFDEAYCIIHNNNEIHPLVDVKIKTLWCGKWQIRSTEHDCQFLVVIQGHIAFYLTFKYCYNDLRQILRQWEYSKYFWLCNNVHSFYLGWVYYNYQIIFHRIKTFQSKYSYMIFYSINKSKTGVILSFVLRKLYQLVSHKRIQKTFLR